MVRGGGCFFAFLILLFSYVRYENIQQAPTLKNDFLELDGIT